MDTKKNRQQTQQQQQQQQQQHNYGRLKGATRIQSEHSNCIEQDQLNKQQEASNNALDSTNNNEAIDELMTNIQRHSSNLPSTANVLFMSAPDSNNLLLTAAASSSSYNIQCSSSNITTLAPTAIPTSTPAANCTQQQYKSPQLLPCDIKSLFECPICFDYAVPPIYQCQNGHLVCQVCSSKITHCPTCRVPITEPSIRNLQLDRLASSFQFPCKYNFNGCQWKSYWFQKREHEDSCEYISYSCPCPGTACKWTGLLAQVMPHLREHHKSITTLSGEDIVFLATDINLKGAVDWVMIQSCFNQHFLLVLEKQELKNGQQQFFAIVQLIGSQKDADKFKYKLELSSNLAGQVKRLQWEATPRSILDGIQVALSTYDCLVFDSRMAQHFLSPIKKDNKSATTTGPDNQPQTNNAENQGENLGINVTIERLVQ